MDNSNRMTQHRINSTRMCFRWVKSLLFAKKKNKSIFQNIRSCYNGVHRMTMATWVRVSKKFAKISRACIIPLAISYLFIHIPDFDARSSHFAITLLDILHKMHPKRSTSNRVVCVWVCSRPTVEYLIMFSWKIK